MPRLRPRPLRGSVNQNYAPRTRSRNAISRFLFKVRLGFILGTIALFLIAILWMWLSGWATHQIKHLKEGALHLTQRAHFAVKDIIVEGRQNTDKDDLFKALGTTAGAPILAFDPKQAHEQLLDLPWVANATIERRLPDTLYVRLTERQPLARWQHDNVTVVIDREGKVLPAAKPEQFADLLLVTGDNAPEQTENLLNSLKEFPDIMPRVKSAVRVGERRWNLYLQSGQLVRMPEQKIDEALKRLDSLIHDQKILDRNVTGIDLRLPDRFILEPGAESKSETKAEKKH